MARVTKTKADYLKRCRRRIERAKRFRKREDYEGTWRRMIDLYRGDQWPENLSYEDMMVVNICFATINVIGPSVAIHYPKVTVHARRSDDEDRAIILEQVTNYWWQHYEMLPEFQAAVKDMLIVGFGWLKSGYRYVEEEVEDYEAYDSELSSRRQEMDDFAASNPDLAAELPTDEDLESNMEVFTQTIITEDRPFMERVSPFDIYVDPDATSMRDAKWIAQRIVKTQEEVAADPRYKASVRKKQKPDSRVPDEYSDDFDSDRKDKEDQHVTIWEKYDIQNRTMSVFADAGDDFLVDPVNMPYNFGHPFTMLRNYDVPDQFYPMGELEVLEPLQHELNLTRTAMFNDRKQFRRRYLYYPDSFDKQGIEMLRSKRDNVAIPIQGTRQLNEIVYPFPTAPGIQAQLYQDSTVIENDITDISGINEYMRGSTPEMKRTATEAAIIQDAANARASDKLARVESALREVSRRMVQLAQQYMDQPQVARLVGATGQDYWFEFDAEDIKGEFDFEVEGGSTQPKNEAQRKKQALDLLDTLAPFGDPAIGLVNIRALIVHVLRYGFDIANPERFLAEGPDPLQQMMALSGEQQPGAEGDLPPIPPQVASGGQDLGQALAAEMGGPGV